MTTLIHTLIFIPLIGFLVSLLIPQKQERLLSGVAFITIGIHLFSFLSFLVIWILNGHQTLDVKDVCLYRSKEYVFLIDFYFDKVTAAYILVGAFLTFLVSIYSRAYLHREVGFKRFFNTILFFYLGYNIAIFAGNFETLFIGWEMLGISSFLLIAFYKDRYLPVKNAIKVFSVYRIGDVGLLLAMWASHHLWHENITFLEMHNPVFVSDHLQNHSFIGVFISLMILVTAAAKSAQLPFSSWLPRAMEGPTPSSAIFYGSLSVHLGVFLLLRTHPFWENQTSVKIIIILLGLTTSIVTTLIARVQSTVKSQIAYSSVAQIGLIFIEIAFGFETLALIHFAGNAFLRTYQLLVSPSVVSYLIREQFFKFTPRQLTIEDTFPKRIEYSVYLLSLKEFNLDAFMNRILWKPLKDTGKMLDFLTIKSLIWILVPAYLGGLFVLFYEDSFPPLLIGYLPTMFSFIALIFVLKAFSERNSVRMAWLMVIMNHFWIALAISFNEHFDYTEILLYLSGIVVMGTLGLFTLRRLKTQEECVDLNQYHGHSFEHPKLALMFLICSLGLTGFPITPTFIGEDLIFSHIHKHQFLLAFFVSSSFIIDGLAVIRIYTRVFLGPHNKPYHEIPFRSS